MWLAEHLAFGAIALAISGVFFVGTFFVNPSELWVKVLAVVILMGALIYFALYVCIWIYTDIVPRRRYNERRNRIED